ncbi:hypothetical protein N3K66_002014 [Trichothecium roseum]|uniref:Uncharacterized protein n=1 Tax=Trichothecium roseum TaxID=47278 RepID=A0ACC0V9T7_9HYPO|nr:hypothetical protein N3K66_002014 [Trichothecium roseum]
MLRAFKNLPPKARMGVGAGIIAWGAAGLYLSDRAEERLGLAPTEEDRRELRKYYAPTITEAPATIPHRQGRTTTTTTTTREE